MHSHPLLPDHIQPHRKDKPSPSAQRLVQPIACQFSPPLSEWAIPIYTCQRAKYVGKFPIALYGKKPDANPVEGGARSKVNERAKAFSEAGKIALSIKLPQEPQVVFVKKPDIVNSVAKHCQPFNAHPESVTLPLFRVVADIFKYRWMDHTATEDFKPARLLADSAPFPFAKNATHKNFGARLGEGEVVGTETNLNPLAKEALGEGIKRSFQISEGHILVNQQTFNLVEGW